MSRPRTPRIAVVGLVSWDRLYIVERYPAPGSYAIVRESLEAPGGRAGNSAVAAARLGAKVSIAALVGDDPLGERLRQALRDEGIDTTWLSTALEVPTDASTIVVSQDPPERTIFWHPGARLTRGCRLDIAAIFEHDIVLLDVDDLPLRRFLVDLPAHTVPTARLLGTLTHLADIASPEVWTLALGHDALVGNQREWLALTGASSLETAIERAQEAMVGHNLRAGLITLGAEGAIAFTARERWSAPAFRVEVKDPTGAGDAFAGAIAYAMALRWPWPEALRVANAVAALATRALGAQTSLPSLEEVTALLGEDPELLGN